MITRHGSLSRQRQQHVQYPLHGELGHLGLAIVYAVGHQQRRLASQCQPCNELHALAVVRVLRAPDAKLPRGADDSERCMWRERVEEVRVVMPPPKGGRACHGPLPSVLEGLAQLRHAVANFPADVSDAEQEALALGIV
eukprot:scaffold40434_cov69-Phaeocystis_antarctica.AAC.3